MNLKPGNDSEKEPGNPEDKSIPIPSDDRESVHRALPEGDGGEYREGGSVALYAPQELGEPNDPTPNFTLKLFPTRKEKGIFKMVYDQRVAETIIYLISQGWAPTAISKLPGMPGLYQIKQWQKTHPEFREMMSLANQARAQMLADTALQIASKSKYKTVQSDKVKTEVALKMAAALDPETFGTKTKILGDPNAPVSFLISTGIVREGDTDRPIEVKLDKSDPAKLTEKELEVTEDKEPEPSSPGRGWGA